MHQPWKFFDQAMRAIRPYRLRVSGQLREWSKFSPIEKWPKYNSSKDRYLFRRMNRIILPMFVAVLTLRGADARAAGPFGPEQRMFELLNKARANEHLPRLEWDGRVAEAAGAHAHLMAKNGNLSHQFPGELGVPERIGRAGSRFTSSAENVALADDPESSHRALMDSPGHRANILNPEYNAVGIGTVEQKGRLYVVEDFVHAVPAYSEVQFLDALVAAFNRAREAKGKRAMEVRADPLLHNAACATLGDSRKVSTTLAGATEVVVFTLSEPHEAPNRLARQASDATLRRMNIGVCFRPDHAHGLANFWVVAEFGG